MLMWLYIYQKPLTLLYGISYENNKIGVNRIDIKKAFDLKLNCFSVFLINDSCQIS